MTMLVENRTISMILTVPDTKELFSDSVVDTSNPPSIPIYHGSIIRIEQNHENENTSDLIVRVPNFHHLALPSVTITINNQQEGKIKRQAPICPIINRNKNNSNHSGLINPKRIAIGLRNLRRTILTNYKSKRTENINEITIIPVLPDVEIIKEDFQMPNYEKKSNKNSNSTSKFFIPKILFIKRKNFKINKQQRQPSVNSVNTQTDEQNNQIKNFNFSIEQPSASNISTSFINPNSDLSTSTEISQNILQPQHVFISNTPIDIQSLNQNDDFDETLYIVHPNGDTYSECYEVTYEFDPEFEHFIENEKQLPSIDLNQPSIKIDLDPFEYQDLTPMINPWISILPSNNYEQIDLSQNNSDQISILPENNQIVCVNDSPIIDEGYTVLIQLLKHALQIESEDDDNDSKEFNKELNQLLSIE